MTVKALTTAERKQHTADVVLVSRNLGTFVETGQALARIRDGRTYRETHKTFGAFCRDTWQITRDLAYKTIAASGVIRALENVDNCIQMPANEAQTRPLTTIDLKQVGEVWQRVVETAPKDENEQPVIIAEHVANVVRDWKTPSPPTAPPELPPGCVSSLQDLVNDGRKFQCIYADPPWKYGNQGTRAATDRHYDTMTPDEIKAEPVAELAAENCHIHLWTTNAFLPIAFDVMAAWGFEYKGVLVWTKPQMGIGNYWRVSHEFLLLGIKGKLPFQDKGQTSWFQADRTKHSRKPREARKRVEKVSPGPYLELYGREVIDGWTIYGNQIEETLFDGE